MMVRVEHRELTTVGMLVAGIRLARPGAVFAREM